MALIRFLRNFPSGPSVKSLKRNGRRNENRVRFGKVQIQFFDLPDSIPFCGFRIIGRICRINDCRLNRICHDDMLPMSVFPVDVMRHHYFRTDLSEIPDKYTFHIFHQEIRRVLHLVLDRNIGQPGHIRISP